MDKSALLRQVHAISKAGKPYTYVAVIVEGQEVSRLFLKPLELKYLFDKE